MHCPLPFADGDIREWGMRNKHPMCYAVNMAATWYISNALKKAVRGLTHKNMGWGEAWSTRIWAEGRLEAQEYGQRGGLKHKNMGRGGLKHKNMGRGGLKHKNMGRGEAWSTRKWAEGRLEAQENGQRRGLKHKNMGRGEAGSTRKWARGGLKHKQMGRGEAWSTRKWTEEMGSHLVVM